VGGMLSNSKDLSQNVASLWAHTPIWRWRWLLSKEQQQQQQQQEQQHRQQQQQ